MRWSMSCARVLQRATCQNRSRFPTLKSPLPHKRKAKKRTPTRRKSANARRATNPINIIIIEHLAGRLSDSNHKYLHGEKVEGCTLDAEERRSRCRVISGPKDERLQLDKFKNAKIIVANNDARYEINKVRAQEYARSTGASLQWSVATDKASNTVLQSEVCSKQTKIRWLRYHDRDTGDLPGMLPIALGMPVALTDHIDRGSKLLLRGRIGFVVAMDWSAGHKQPSVVFLKFDNVDWQLDGTSEPGIYPIEPVTRTWFLDRNKPKPVLKVVRRQLPLCPAFAITAHFSQGKTMEAAILDLMIDKITDVSYGTVATSRVRSREDVLILRPFPLWLHQRGSQNGPPHLCPPKPKNKQETHDEQDKSKDTIVIHALAASTQFSRMTFI